MRKHDVRKWLHAVLDLLPVILIPVFMIYSHRHTLTERTEVEVNYKYESNEVNTLDDLVEGNIYYFDELHYENNNIDFNFNVVKMGSISIIDFTSTYTDELYIDDYSNDNLNNIYVSCYDNSLNLSMSNDKGYSNLVYEDCEFTLSDFVFIYSANSYGIFNFFGSPQYTDYNVIESVTVNDTNSDIMSVFMDDFNNAIDKYFNMGNVFNLGGVYQWFDTNIFGGHAPTVIYSVWNIALYELVMDLLFLLYGLFMWFIDMVEKLMEKPINSVR